MSDTESESDSEGQQPYQNPNGARLDDASLRRPLYELMQTATAFLGRAVSIRELMAAWDKCASVDNDTVEKRSHATLERLLTTSPEKKAPAGTGDGRPKAALPLDSSDGVQEVPARAGPSRAVARQIPRKEDKGRKRLFMPEDEWDDNGDSSIEFIGRSVKKPRIQASSSKKKERVVIDLDSDLDENEAAAQRQSQAGGSKRASHRADVGKKPILEKAASSSSSSGSNSDIAKVGERKRKASTPLTPPQANATSKADYAGLGREVEHNQPLMGDELEVQEEPSFLVKVLAMVPDVDEAHAQSLIDKFGTYEDVVERVIDELFSDVKYPKATVTKDKGKGRASAAPETMEEKEKRYMDTKTRGEPSSDYFLAAFEQLDIDFPSVPKPTIRIMLNQSKFYTPTYFALAATLEQADPPYQVLARPRKHKGRSTAPASADFDTERAFVVAKVAADKASAAAKAAEEQQEALEEAAGHVFECGCCFGDYVFSKMVQCPEAHLFCKDCARRNAENVMGNRQTVVQCMDQDGCTAPFSDKECERFLKPNQIQLLEKLRSESALDAAGIAGLVKCPYCPWACVIENPDERLFECKNEECGKVTCRTCQKANHLPKTCEEHAEDLKKNNIHKVEEAMTAAALRSCPKCKLVYIKEYGCNKMMCTTRGCGAISCYLCSEIITGYGHFKGQALGGEGPDRHKLNTTSKCILWDQSEGKNEYERVEQARKAAIEELRAAAAEAGDDAPTLNEEELAKLAAEKPDNMGYRLHPGQVPRAHMPAFPQMARAGMQAVQQQYAQYFNRFQAYPGAGQQGVPGAMPGPAVARAHAYAHHVPPVAPAAVVPGPAQQPAVPAAPQAPHAAADVDARERRRIRHERKEAKKRKT